MQEIVHTNALAPHQHECSTPTRIHNILTHREHIFFNTTTYSQTHRQYISLSLMLHISLFLFLSVFISLCIRLLDLLRFLSSVFLSFPPFHSLLLAPSFGQSASLCLTFLLLLFLLRTALTSLYPNDSFHIKLFFTLLLS